MGHGLGRRRSSQRFRSDRGIALCPKAPPHATSVSGIVSPGLRPRRASVSTRSASVTWSIGLDVNMGPFEFSAPGDFDAPAVLGGNGIRTFLVAVSCPSGRSRIRLKWDPHSR